MKRWLIIAIMLAFGVYLAPPGKAQSGSQDHQQSSENKCVQASLICLDKPWAASEANRPTENQSPLDNKAPEWALIIVGIITFFVIGWQAVLMRQHAEHLKELSKAAANNAQVALTQANYIVASERVWIVVSVEESPVGVYRFWAENKGKTPARTVSFWGESLYVERDNEYVEKPDETTQGALLQFPPCLMPPGDRRVVWECYRSAIEEASGGGKGEQSRFAKGFGAGFIYGRIRYFDVLDAQPQEPHETRWLYWLIPQPGSVPFPHPLQPHRNTYT